MGSGARRGGAVGAWDFAGGGWITFETLWSRKSVSARGAAGWGDGAVAAKIWRGAVVGCLGGRRIIKKKSILEGSEIIGIFDGVGIVSGNEVAHASAGI